MKLLKEQEIILEDPFVIRPGADVTVRAELTIGISAPSSIIRTVKTTNNSFFLFVFLFN